MVQYENSVSTFLVHSIINFLNTTDESFNTYMKKMMSLFIQKSTPISAVNETERVEFFTSMRNKVTAAKQKVS